MIYSNLKIMYNLHLVHKVDFKKEIKKIKSHRHSYMGDLIVRQSSSDPNRYPSRPVDQIYRFLFRFKSKKLNLNFDHIKILYKAKLKEKLNLNERIEPYLDGHKASRIGDFVYNNPIIYVDLESKSSILDFLIKYRISNEKS